MSKSKLVIDRLAKLFEQGLVSYKDLNSEILNILRSKKDEMDILSKRIENLEKKLDKFEKRSVKKKTKKAK